jgi:hypothetical protein
MDFYNHVNQLFHDWSYGHPHILYGLMRSMRPHVAVEIGTYRGFGASWMAKALQENNQGRLYCVDNFSLTDHEARYGDARRHLTENLTKLGVRDFVEILDGNSDEVKLPDTIDFAYIDGWHGYLAARTDFENCDKRGAECVCFDDTTQSAGPRMLVEEIRETGQWDVIEILRDCGMSICIRKQEKGPITFSQEIPPPHKGTILFELTAEQQKHHFEHASKLNKVRYDRVIPYLAPPISK